MSNRNRRRWVVAGTLLLLAAALNWVVFPLPVEKLKRPGGTFVYSRDGHLLNAFTAPDRFWRKPITLDQLPPQLVNSIITIEDRWFYWHPGFNPVALITATYDNVTAGRSVRGGSTITMQIARMMEPKERTIINKAVEILRALQLEIRFSKRELLEIYFNLTPYGGNIEGVGAASYLYFGKNAKQLSIGEMAMLAAIPSSPNRYRPDAAPDACRMRRNRVLRQLYERRLISDDEFTQALKEAIPPGRITSPVAAPHFCQMVMLQQLERSDLHSTLDYQLQIVCERMARLYQLSLAQKGIHNLAMVVIDNQSGELQAMVGSADFGDIAHQGQVNGALAPRSPGSALKPFIYALGIEQGLVSPAMKVEDLPVNYAGYMPANYDGEFHGLVSVEEALIQSLNVPAVDLTARLGLARVYALLQEGGISTLTRRYQDYGLPLVLGACEVNLLELTNLYAALGRGGTWLPLRTMQSVPSAPGHQLFRPEACYLVSEILSELKRPDLPTSWEFTPDMPKVAWKTGTSYGRKDAWAIGYNPEYTIGVWAGNFSAEGSIAIVGAEIAAPLMLDIFNHLYSKRPAPWYTPHPNVQTRSVCAVSGKPPTPACPDLISEEYLTGLSPVHVCDVHRTTLVDMSTGFGVCSYCATGKSTEQKVTEHWPPRVASWLVRQGIISIPPAHNPECTGLSIGENPIITSPEHKATYYVQSGISTDYQKILFEASTASDSREVHWFLDGQLFATSTTDARVFYRPQHGDHRLMCVDTYGRSASVAFRVE